MTQMTMNPALTPEQWREVDEALFSGARLDALLSIRQRTQASLSHALELLYERYQHLREEHAEKFVLSQDEYWIGWYS